MDFQKYKSSDNHMKIKVLFHFFSGKKSPMSICQKKLEPKGFCLKST